MVKVDQIDVNSKAQVNEFIMFPFQLYKDVPQWVPPFLMDIRAMLNPKKHPFYEHSEADFFVARRDGKIAGRIAALENKPYNKYHGTKQAVFYLLETEDDREVVSALFERVYDWAHKRGLNALIGPKGFSAFDGYGIQVEGFQHRQMMTMMNYNLAHLPTHMDALGFTREVDFVSCYMRRDKFALPEKARIIADKVQEHGTFEVKNFENKAELKKWAWRIGQAYNKTFVNNWEYYPFTENEIKFVVDQLITVADARLIKLILHKGDVVGFLLAFPDVSAALQRGKGRITPWGIVDIMLEMKRTKWVSLNGVGVLPEYQGRGGNALMYSEMEKTIKDFGFIHAEQTQMADTAVQVRKDMITIGAEIYKRHRVYHKDI